jgi:large subunit ribosomal protein L4
MPEMDVYNWNKEKVGTIILADEVFQGATRPHLYHDCVRAELLSRRRGTVLVKSRSMVSGTTRKMYRQKGTGRARHGDRRAPIFRHGGICFGPVPRDYELRIPKKVRKSAIISALSERTSSGRLIILDSMAMDEPKTKNVFDAMKRFGLGSALFIDGDNKAMSLSCRNLPNAKFLHVKGLNLFDLLKYENLVMTKDAVLQLEGVLKR